MRLAKISPTFEPFSRTTETYHVEPVLAAGQQVLVKRFTNGPKNGQIHVAVPENLAAAASDPRKTIETAPFQPVVTRIQAFQGTREEKCPEWEEYGNHRYAGLAVECSDRIAHFTRSELTGAIIGATMDPGACDGNLEGRVAAKTLAEQLLTAAQAPAQEEHRQFTFVVTDYCGGLRFLRYVLYVRHLLSWWSPKRKMWYAFGWKPEEARSPDTSFMRYNTERGHVARDEFPGGPRDLPARH